MALLDRIGIGRVPALGNALFLIGRPPYDGLGARRHRTGLRVIRRGHGGIGAAHVRATGCFRIGIGAGLSATARDTTGLAAVVAAAAAGLTATGLAAVAASLTAARAAVAALGRTVPSDLKEMTRVVGVVEIALIIADNRCHAVLSLLRSGLEHQGRLVITQAIYVHVSAARVRWIAFSPVHSEVHVSLRPLDGHEGRTLNLVGNLLSICLQHLLNVHAFKIDHGQHAVLVLPVALESTYERTSTADRRRRGRRVGKLDGAELLYVACIINDELMQRAILLRHRVDKAFGQNERGADRGICNLQTRNLTRKVRREHVNLSLIVADGEVIADHDASGPVITGRVGAHLARKGTRADVESAHRTTHRKLVLKGIEHRHIDIAIVHRKRAQGLPLTRCGNDPNRLESFGGNGLQIPARQGNHDDAA